MLSNLLPSFWSAATSSAVSFSSDAGSHISPSNLGPPSFIAASISSIDAGGLRCATDRPSTFVSVRVAAVAYRSSVGLFGSFSHHVFHFSSNPSADPNWSFHERSHGRPRPTERMKLLNAAWYFPLSPCARNCTIDHAWS